MFSGSAPIHPESIKVKLGLNDNSTRHEHYMRLALQEADKAEALGDVPVGCVVVHQGQVVGFGYNQRQHRQDPCAHAEIIALQQAATHFQSWRLLDCVVYVTLEPCPMCAGALVNSRVRKVVYGCADPKAGALHSLYQLGQDPRLNHRFESVPGVLAEECASRLSHFFEGLRNRS